MAELAGMIAVCPFSFSSFCWMCILFFILNSTGSITYYGRVHALRAGTFGGRVIVINWWSQCCAVEMRNVHFIRCTIGMQMHAFMTFQRTKMHGSKCVTMVRSNTHRTFPKGLNGDTRQGESRTTAPAHDNTWK